MKTLLIDNYDSFTYNLFQLLAEANGDEPIVVRNDTADWDELERLEFDNIVISPGPGSPDHEGDFGVCAEAIRRAQVPLLGVCLGHQGLTWVHGGKVLHAPEVMHGRISAVLHEDSPLFAGIPREFQAVRYHSLCVEQPLPPELEAIARHERRRRDGGRPPHPPAVGGAVPPRVDLHRLRPPAARKLPRPDQRVRSREREWKARRGCGRRAHASPATRSPVAQSSC